VCGLTRVKCLNGQSPQQRGEVDPAFQWLERALKERDATLTSIKSDPLFQRIKTDPRYRRSLTAVSALTR
jgi:hypothetical protein